VVLAEPAGAHPHPGTNSPVTATSGHPSTGAREGECGEGEDAHSLARVNRVNQANRALRARIRRKAICMKNGTKASTTGV
jgi:hypothetical protein